MLKSKIVEFIPAAAFALLLAQPCLGSAYADAAATFDDNATRMTEQSRQIAKSRFRSTATQHAKDVVVNPARDYPPSCLNDGLGANLPIAGDPVFTSTMRLYGDPAACVADPHAAECTYEEDVQVRAWRVACSGGKSATLMEINRAAGMEGNFTLYPTMPSVGLLRGPLNEAARLAEDPNTTVSEVSAYSPIFYNRIFVIENYYNTAIAGFGVDMNLDFVLSLNSIHGTAIRNLRFSFPTYNPAQYANGALPLQINGFMSSNWFDPAHDNEGILTQIFEIPSDPNHRIFTFAWYTYNPYGAPIWLFGSGVIARSGDASRLATVPTYYFDEGGFAGSFGSHAVQYSWGNVQFSFPDCAHMDINFSGGSSVSYGPTPPSGSGLRHWSRIGNINGLTCE